MENTWDMSPARRKRFIDIFAVYFFVVCWKIDLLWMVFLWGCYIHAENRRQLVSVVRSVLGC